MGNLPRFLVRLLIFLFAVYMLSGCATATKRDLDSLNQNIQDCILSGGHPRLGPENTVICDH